jgi:hypothetical protein
MNRYFVSLRIDNVLASVPNGTPARKGGFLAARDVDAESEQVAYSTAKVEVLADPIFLALAKNHKDDLVVISAEEIVVVEKPIAKKRAIGYAWFSEP